jgi:uncharacterized protein YbjT (DUF2867 family)
MSQSPTILVYGSTGPQQRPVAEQLLDAGFAVRVLVRSAVAAEGLARRGAEVFVGDLSNPETLRNASRGVDAVSLFVPFMNPQPAFGRNALEAARDAGVRRIVWNPTGAVPPTRIGNPGMDVRVDLKELLQDPHFDAVIIEPTAYMENFLMPALVEELKSRDSFAYPMPPTARMQWVSHGDVAQFIVKAFQTPSVSRTSIAVSGPEALTGDEIAERMSKGLGRPIRFRPMPPREFGAVLDRAFGPGTGERVVGFYEAMFEQPALFNSNVDLSAALARLPIAPTTVEAWARARASDLT